MRFPIRHPRLRVAGIEIVQAKAPEIYQQLRRGILDAVAMLPNEWRTIVRPEGCGSFFFLCSRPWSDIDINLAVDDPMDLNALNHTLNLQDTKTAMRELGERLGANIEVAARTVTVTSAEAQRRMKEAGSPIYPVFDFISETWHGKRAGQVFPHTLHWNRPQKWWEVYPQKDATFGIAADAVPFQEDEDEWRSRYGEDFLEVTPYVVNDHNPV
jgi:hypothetical protein